ncbi:hypothetical protein PLICRDRAFT_172206 [Plicaturopsis crispa FD-325 SS-3]|nr:hypothetical protein PLICRDRAFT_172206 [Plicaturopsis crispa FD-325 SS-3]
MRAARGTHPDDMEVVAESYGGHGDGTASEVGEGREMVTVAVTVRERGPPAGDGEADGNGDVDEGDGEGTKSESWAVGDIARGRRAASGQSLGSTTVGKDSRMICLMVGNARGTHPDDSVQSAEAITAAREACAVTPHTGN